jgi:hypothetical protein
MVLVIMVLVVDMVKYPSVAEVVDMVMGVFI